MAEPKVRPSSEEFFAQSQRVLNTIMSDEGVPAEAVEHLCDLAAALATTAGMVRQQEMVVQASKDARDMLNQLPVMPAVGGNYN